MNVKKTIKKIAAVATGTALLGATILGAAADLSAYPAPFVANGVADVQFVIGSGSTDDYLGVLDIATNLQASAVTSESVAVGGSASASVADGVQVEGAGVEEYLALNESFADEEFDSADLPDLLADGTVVDDDGEDESDVDLDNEEIDYDQILTLTNVDVVYTEDPSTIDDPMLYLEEAAYTLSVEFDDPINFVGLEDGEIIEIAGKAFTVGVDTTADDLILFGSDVTTFLELNAPKTIEADDDTYTVEIVGADSDGDDNSIILDVNGVRKTVVEGDSTTVNGLDVYVKDVFVTNIPTLSASANVFVGSNEYKIDSSSVEIDGEDVDSYSISLDGSDFTNITLINFTYNINNEEADDDEILLMGNSRVDPVFGTFELNFAGSSLELMDEAKTPIMIAAGGSNLVLSFVNEDGEAFDLEVVEEDTTIEFVDEFILDPLDVYNNGSTTAVDLEDGDYFIASDGDTRTSIFEITDIDGPDTEITVKDLGTGNERVYDEGDAIDDTEYLVGTVTDNSGTPDTVTVTGTTDNVIDVMGESTITITNETEIVIAENGDDVSETASDGELTVTSALSDSDDIEMSVAENYASVDKDDDTETALSDFGTYYEIDEDGNDLAVYIPVDDEVEYNVFIAPTGSTVTVSGGSSVMADKVNPIAVGVAVKDVDVNLANPAKNLIVVGGTCINAISAQLSGVAEGTCGTDSGLNPGEATIEMFDLDNGKVAMLVAGWEATETQAAARALATGADLSGSKATLTVTSVSDYMIQ